MKRAALMGAILIALLVGGAHAAGELTLTVVSQTNSTITFGWQPQPGFGYLFSTKSSADAAWVLVSRTNDPTRSTVKFSKTYSYEVAVIVKGQTGIYPTSPPPPPPDTQQPTVTMAAPANGSTVSGTISVSANASDNVGVARVEFFRDGNPIGTDSSAPYSVQFDTTGLANASGYTFGARAYDAANNVGLAPQVVVTVNNATPPPPPPPPGGSLLWKPPVLMNPTTVQVSSTNRYLDLDPTRDYIIKMPSTPLGRSSNPSNPALWIVGGRNIVLIGGEILIDQLAIPSLGSFNQRGIVLSGNKGTVHIEGVWMHGDGLSNGVSFDNGRGNIGTVQIQNTRIESMHPTWHTNQGAPVEVHPDSLQSWQGPEVLRLYQDTIFTNGTLGFILPRQYSSSQPLGQWDYRRVNMVHYAADSYALWKDTAVWAEYHEDLWLQTNPNHVASAYHSAWAGSGNCWTCWNPGGSWPITGQAFQIGLRPAGDFVPVGVAGTAYISPGYQ